MAGNGVADECLAVLAEEFDRIEQVLGRAPNFTELSIFSAMWSEHCSYKNSISCLSDPVLPTLTGTQPSSVSAILGDEGRGQEAIAFASAEGGRPAHAPNSRRIFARRDSGTSAVMATVGEGLMRASASERNGMGAPVCNRNAPVIGSAASRGKGVTV